MLCLETMVIQVCDNTVCAKGTSQSEAQPVVEVSVTPTPVQVAREQLLLEGELKPFHSVVLRLPVTDETHIAPALDRVAEVLGNQVSIGSYPVSTCSTPCQC